MVVVEVVEVGVEVAEEGVVGDDDNIPENMLEHNAPDNHHHMD